MLHSKKIIIFDLDDTLAESKASISPSMSETLGELLSRVNVGIITGGNWDQIKKQVIDNLPEASSNFLHRLHVMPTCGTRLFIYNNGQWEKVYEEYLEESERKKIIRVLNEAVVGEYDMSTLYGDIVEDRGSQITLSLLGQKAPVHIKKVMDPEQVIRKRIVEKVSPQLSEYEIRIGGATSIDVTKKGRDKAFGIKRVQEHLGILLSDIGFLGDAIFEGGNDYSAHELGLDYIKVTSPEDTEQHIKSWFA